MKSNQIRIVVILGSFVIAGLLIIQMIWLKRAFDIHEKEFNHTVQIALQQVGNSLMNPDYSGSGNPVQIKQLSSKFYLAILNSQIDPGKLDTLLKKEFSLRHINLNYEFGIYNAHDDTLVYGAYIPATVRLQSAHIPSVEPGNLPPGNFAVYFPNKTGYLAGEMKIWIFATVILLFVIFFFVYAIVVILREKRLTEFKEDFINNMTHEFKTPISNIELASDVLMNKKQQLTSEKLTRYASIIHQENQRLKFQVDKVLTNGQLHSKNLELNKKLTDIHQLLRDISVSMAFKIKLRRGTLRCNFNAGNSRLTVDPAHLGNAFLNIVDNAEKYSPGNPDITISTSNEKAGLRISISDKGRGISKDLQHFVFDKFFRIPREDHQIVKGFGLGLSYVKSVVEAHHGQVHLKSEVNQGTRMDIVLPYE